MVDFEPHRRRPAVDDQLDAPAQVGEHMLRGGRRDVSGPVRRRRHQRPAESGQDVARDRMARNPHRNCIKAGSGKLGDRTSRTPGQHQRQWPGPERRGEPFGGPVETGERLRRGHVGDVGDERIERGAALGVVKARNGAGIGGIGAEPVDGFGGKGDEAAGREHACRNVGRRPAVTGRVRLYHTGCRWRGHRGYLCLRRRRDAVIRRPSGRRSVAQSGSAPRSGRGGRRFKSCHSDQIPSGRAEFLQASAIAAALERQLLPLWSANCCRAGALQPSGDVRADCARAYGNRLQAEFFTSDGVVGS